MVRMLRMRLSLWGIPDPASGPSDEEWESQKEVIEQLLVDEDLDLHEVGMFLLESIGFQVGEASLLRKILEWGFENSMSDRQVFNARNALRRWQVAALGLESIAASGDGEKDEIAPVSKLVLNAYNNGIPAECPFFIRPMNDERSLFLIREKDVYGEYPNIFAKFVHSDSYQQKPSNRTAASLIILCDTGCGTNVELRKLHSRAEAHMNWNIGSFLEATINPDNRLPYLVITSHCHYDHILGINNLNLARSTVLSSAFDKSFITPRSHLAEHSLCNRMGIPPPEYDVGMWAEDFQEVVFTLPHGSQPVSTGITILQTPGHTPDSLAWYDSTLSPPHIFVGDTLYERQSEEMKNAKWGREPLMPTIFNVNSNLAGWSQSMDKMVNFVRERNMQLDNNYPEVENSEWVLVPQASGREHKSQRVMLSAAHVTVSVDAEECLLDMMKFMGRILQDQVPCCWVEDEKQHEVWLWDDMLDVEHSKNLETSSEESHFGRFSVRAPLFVIEKERDKRRRETCKDEDGKANM